MFGSSHELSRLWCEEFRPKTVNEYVFKNPQLKALVEDWIKTKNLPHVLFHGPAGTGKCLGPNEKISVRLNTNNLTEKQIEFIKTL